MRLGIIGSRTFNDEAKLIHILDNIYNDVEITLVVSGHAAGADIMGERWAIANNIKTLIFIPDWNKYGKRAGFVRNEDIIRNCDEVIAFWDCVSRGTLSSIKLAKQYNVPSIIISF